MMIFLNLRLVTLSKSAQKNKKLDVVPDHRGSHVKGATNNERWAQVGPHSWAVHAVFSRERELSQVQLV